MATRELNQEQVKVFMKELGLLARKWRSYKTDALVAEYHQTLDKLFSIGWRGELPVEIELPDENMPNFYLEQFVD